VSTGVNGNASHYIQWPVGAMLSTWAAALYGSSIVQGQLGS